MIWRILWLFNPFVRGYTGTIRPVRSSSSDRGSHCGELNTFRPRYCSTVPLITIWLPAGNRSASHGWLNQVAWMRPVPSLIIVCTITWLLRVRRARVSQTVPMIVTCSPYSSRLIGFSTL